VIERDKSINRSPDKIKTGPCAMNEFPGVCMECNKRSAPFVMSHPGHRLFCGNSEAGIADHSVRRKLCEIPLSVNVRVH
jgi:hypothetical protein